MSECTCGNPYLGYVCPMHERKVQSLPALEKLAREKERTCQFCKHWECKWGRCDVSGTENTAWADIKTDRTVIRQMIQTSPYFGCILWESK